MEVQRLEIIKNGSTEVYQVSPLDQAPVRMPNHVWKLRDEFRLTLQPADLVFNILVAYCAWLEKSAFILWVEEILHHLGW
jgi:hypothetical protein